MGKNSFNPFNTSLHFQSSRCWVKFLSSSAFHVQSPGPPHTKPTVCDRGGDGGGAGSPLHQLSASTTAAVSPGNVTSRHHVFSPRLGNPMKDCWIIRGKKHIRCYYHLENDFFFLLKKGGGRCKIVWIHFLSQSTPNGTKKCQKLSPAAYSRQFKY